MAPGAQPLRAPDALAEKIVRQRSSIEGERKQVTVMFADIVSSMKLTRALETEKWGLVLDRFLSIGSRAIHDVEGTVNQFTGDGLMAVFGAPLAYEDHARRACLATLRFQSDLNAFAADVAREHGIDFRVRCGLNSGEVIVGDIGEDLHMDFAPIGNTSGMAKRMEALAPPGSTAISASTAALVEGEFEVRELGEFEVKGAAESQRVFELVGVGAAQSRLEAAAARGLSGFVGREQEQGVLEATLERAILGHGQVVSVVGDPGVGKSRLCREFAAACRDRGIRVDSGAAVAHGRHVPLLAVLAMFREFFGIAEGDPPEQARSCTESLLLDLDPDFESELGLIFDFLGIPDPQRPPERADPDARQRHLFAFVRRLVEARSHDEPTVIVIEDLHWIDEASAAFLGEFVAAVDGTRTLLVVTFRPEYDSEWIGSANAKRLVLDPLDSSASRELLEELIGDDPSLDGLPEAIAERTAGNPFFIEEVVRTLAESGHLAGDRGCYTLQATLEELVLPPTVQAVLSARIDRLARRDKELLHKMSVIGREVPEALLVEVGDLERADLEEAVATLQAAEFLTETRSEADREFAFKHPLTQEVAYTSQLLGARARAHGAVAAAIEGLYPDALDDRAALLAHHAEAAGETLKAAKWHARAAEWISVSTPAEGMRHWRRVRELSDRLTVSPEADQLAAAARIGMLALAWRLGLPHEELAAIHAEGEQRVSPGPRESPAPPSAESSEHPPGARTDDPLQRIRLDLGRAGAFLLTGREREGMDALANTRKEAGQIADPGLQLTVSAFSGLIAFWVRGASLRDALAAADRALAAARDDVLAGSGFLLGNAYAHCLWVRAACRGFLGDLAQALPDYERAIAIAREHGDNECEQYALDSRSGLLAQVGDPADALADAEQALELGSASGAPNRIASAQAFLASARLRADDAVGAGAAAEAALESVRGQSLGLNFEPWLLAILADARLRLGEAEAAVATAEESNAIARARSLRAAKGQLALARALMAIPRAEALDNAGAALSAALDETTAEGFRIYEPEIHAERAAVARLRGDEQSAVCEEAEAERIFEEITAPAEAAVDTDQEVESLTLDMLRSAGLLFTGKEREGATGLKAGFRRVLELGQPDLVLEPSYAAAYACWVTGAPQEGVDFIDQAIELAGEDTRDRPGVAMKSPYAHALWVRALCAGSMGRYDQALRDLEHSVEHAREHGDPECEGFTHECRSRVLADQGEIEAAREEAMRAVDVAEKAGNTQAMASALASLAAIHNDAGDFDEGRRAADAGLEIVRGKGAGQLWEPDLLAALSTASLSTGDPADARAKAEDAISLARSRTLRRAEILGHLALARALTESEDPEAHEGFDTAVRRVLELVNEGRYWSLAPRVQRELASSGWSSDGEKVADGWTGPDRLHAEPDPATSATASSGDDQVERLVLELLRAASLLFGGSEPEGARALKSGFRRLLNLERPALALEASSAAAFACWVTGTPREGLEFIASALKLADGDVLSNPGLGLKSPYAHALAVRGACAGYLGELENAYRDLQRAVKVAQERNDPEAHAFAHGFRSLLLSEVDEPRLAAADANRTVEMARATGNHQGLASALAILAAARNGLGEWGPAHAAATEGLSIARRHGIALLWEPDLLAALAIAAVGLGDVRQAQASAETAVSIATARSLKRGEIVGQLALARVLCTTANGGRDAAKALERALEVAAAGGYRVTEPRIHRERALLARARGDEQTALRESAEEERVLLEMGVDAGMRTSLHPRPPAKRHAAARSTGADGSPHG